MTAPRPGDPFYIEHVTTDPKALAASLAAAHAWTFDGPVETLGGALVAVLPGGSRCGVRAPMSDTERPVTRSYIRVADLAAATAQAEAAGGKVILSAMPLGEHGSIVILEQGGIEFGLWQP